APACVVAPVVDGGVAGVADSRAEHHQYRDPAEGEDREMLHEAFTLELVQVTGPLLDLPAGLRPVALVTFVGEAAEIDRGVVLPSTEGEPGVAALGPENELTGLLAGKVRDFRAVDRALEP